MAENLVEKEPRGKINTLIIVPRYNLTNKENYNYWMPLSLGYIIAVIKKAGYNVDCLNLNHYNGTTHELVQKKLDEKRYDFVGTGNNALGYSVTEKIMNAAKTHKSKPKFILGGAIITSKPNLIFEMLNPDFAVMGEGEETIVELLDCFSNKGDFEKVKGIIFRDKQGKIIFTEKREYPSDLDKLPFPDVDALEISKWIENKYCNGEFAFETFDYPRSYYIIGSRGCPFNCTFCYHEGRYRMRSVENIIKELEMAIAEYKVNIITLVDDCFLVDKSRVKLFCYEIKKLIKKSGYEIKWTTNLTVNVDLETLKMLKDSGANEIAYGFESFSPEVLKSMKKPITPQMIENTFYNTLKAGLGIQAQFIFGDIAETKETAYRTLNWWKKNCKGQVRLLFVQPYPGSEIYKYCLENKIIKDEKDYIRNIIGTLPILNMTRAMSDEEIIQLRKDILDYTSKYCYYVYPIRAEKQKDGTYEFEAKCPFCNEINIYKNCKVDTRLYSISFPCRKCCMRYNITTSLKRFLLKNHNKLRAIRDLQLKISKFLKKSKM